jgi:hypothetical protein
MRGTIHLGLVLLAVSLVPAPARGVDVVPDWEGLPFNPYPLAPAVPIEPVLSAADVTDEPAWFVADPFLFHEDGVWHMFFEVYSRNGNIGKIGHATSSNGLQWTYDRVVLEETFHLAFPFVFKADGTYYMIVCPSDTHDIELYAAHDFPYGWEYERTLVTGRTYADPVIVRHDDLWWLFSGQSSSGNCYLFYAYSLTAGWIEHPMSPIVNDAAKGRPAGRFFTFGNGRLIRLAQKNDQWYGQAVRAFEVDVLTRVSYAEHEIPESPILSDAGHGWNSDGMHTCDAWWNGDHWLAVVDGIADLWSIGIYRTAFTADIEAPADAAAARLVPGRSEPNPFDRATRITYEVGPGAPEMPIRLAVYAADGRLVRMLSEGPPAPGRQSVVWDGRDDLGRPVAAGTYFYLLEGADQRAIGRLVRMK